MRLIDKLNRLYKLALDAKHPKIFSFHDCLPDIFSRYIELLLVKRYYLLGAQELLERLESRAPSGREAVLTFDDGRRNVWTVIFPLLKKYRIKAILFVIPGRVQDTDEVFPNLEDFWQGRVSWENLYITHRRQPYLTWRELDVMQSSGLVDIFSHGLRHEVVRASNRVVDFQHPGVYEMPVYFDEWYQSGCPMPDTLWGTPVYERSWAPMVQNIYVPDSAPDAKMSQFVKTNGAFLFFRKKNWRKKLFDVWSAQKNRWPRGTFKKCDTFEDAAASVASSKEEIERRLKNACLGFSLPLYQTNDAVARALTVSKYRMVFTGPTSAAKTPANTFLLNRIPSFWIKFLSYL
jgi:hypothetical protein